MNETTPMLRELTLRYAVRPDQTGQPIPVGRPLTDPRCAAHLLMPVLADEACEVFRIVLLSVKHTVLAYHEVSRGSLDSTSAQPRDVFKVALLANAAAIVLAHYVPRHILRLMWRSELCGRRSISL